MRTQQSRMRKLYGGSAFAHAHIRGWAELPAQYIQEVSEQADKKPRVDSGKVAIIGRQGSTSSCCSFSYASVLLVSAVVLLGDAGPQ